MNIGFKKLAILGGILAAVLAAVLGFLFVSSSDKDLIVNEGLTAIPTLNPQESSSLTTFNSGPVVFEYPETATVNTAPIAGGGESISVVPQVATNPTIEIQITSAAETPIQRMHEIFTAYGFQRQEVLMGEGNTIQATMYKGAISFPDKPLQEEVVIFEKDGNVYKIQMVYYANTVDPQASEAFQAVISTFKP